jgi:NADPH:quinone reductase-like Zn-dependent oxidoreductase
MRAILIREPGDERVLSLGEAPSPPLGPADIRIRVRTTAVNRADLLQRQGLYPPPPGASPVLGLSAGEVVEVGPAHGFIVGQRVMARCPAAATPRRS